MIGDYTHTEFNLSDLYYRLWGYRALPFPSGDIKSALTDISPTGTINAIRSQYKQGSNGTPIIAPLGMGGINSREIKYLPIEVQMKIQAKQRIIKRYTHHQRKLGSVKEEWGLDDYDIHIRGVLFDDANVLEGFEIDDNIRFLNDMAVEGIVKAESPLLALFDINYMAITSISFPFENAGLELVPFEISAISDFRKNELLIQNM